MESLLEQQRRYLEERERLMEAMVHEMIGTKKSQKEQINSDHRVRMLLDRYLESTEKAKTMFEDRDGTRREDVTAMGGPNEFNEFYARLKQIKEFHKKHPNEVSVPMTNEFAELDLQREQGTLNEDLVMFTDEEGYGRFLDLHEHHTKYINLKGVEKVDYLTYLSVFDRFFEISKERKNAAYKEYLDSVLNYFADYISRIKPLIDINGELNSAVANFEKLWKEGSFPGWPKEQHSAMAHGGAHLDLSAFSSWQELSSLGLDRLKSALIALGLKCGGTLEERAQRLFSTKGKSLEEIDSSLFAKAKPEKTGKSKDMDKYKDVASLEAQVYHLLELVSEQLAATKENVTRKQARGLSELVGEEEEEDEVAGASGIGAKDDADDDEVPYNPKNLPLDWNGKPIPYWLYKLHGLNMYFTCEICGNYTYRGPKAFQLHFSEWRHAHGMRCLGIPNTAHFANVTQIEDALALWERIKVEKEVERFKNETEEECEDSMGNVINRKTYDDLRRQGLL